MEDDAQLQRLMRAWRGLSDDGREFVINTAETMQKYPGMGRLSVVQPPENTAQNPKDGR